MIKKLSLLSLFALSGIACAMDNPVEPELIATRAYFLRLNHKGDMLAIARSSLEEPLKLCSITSEGKIKDVSFKLRSRAVASMDFDFSDRYLATCNTSKIVRIFSTENGEQVASVDVLVDSIRIAFCPKTGRLAYSGYGGTTDGTTLGLDYRTIGITKITELGITGEHIIFNHCHGIPARLSFDSTGNNLIVSHSSPTNAIKVYDAESGIERLCLSSPGDECPLMCIDQKNNRLAFAQEDAKKIHIYDLNELKKIKELSYNTKEKCGDLLLMTMNFDNTGSFLAVVLRDVHPKTVVVSNVHYNIDVRGDKVVVYDVASEKMVHEYSSLREEKIVLYDGISEKIGDGYTNELGRNITAIIPMPTGKHVVVLCSENGNSYTIPLS